MESGQLSRSDKYFLKLELHADVGLALALAALGVTHEPHKVQRHVRTGKLRDFHVVICRGNLKNYDIF